MYLQYYRRSPAELARLEADPNAALQEFISQKLDETGTQNAFSLEKDWHALQFLLTGDAALDAAPGATPAERAIRGARETAIECTYGKMRALDPGDVRAVAAALAGISANELKRRFDRAAFNRLEIYPNPRPGGWTLDELAPLLEMMYPELVKFFAQAAAAGDAVLIALE